MTEMTLEEMAMIEGGNTFWCIVSLVGFASAAVTLTAVTGGMGAAALALLGFEAAKLSAIYECLID